jgi:hypothetical protein
MINNAINQPAFRKYSPNTAKNSCNISTDKKVHSCNPSLDANNLRAIQRQACTGHAKSLNSHSNSVVRSVYPTRTKVGLQSSLAYPIQGDTNSIVSEENKSLVAENDDSSDSEDLLEPEIRQPSSSSGSNSGPSRGILPIPDDNRSDTVLTIKNPPQRRERHRITLSETGKGMMGEMFRHGTATFLASGVSGGIQALGKLGLERSPRITQLVTGSLAVVTNAIAGIQAGKGLASYIWPNSERAKWIGGSLGGLTGILTPCIPIFSVANEVAGAKKGIALLATSAYSIARDFIQGGMKGLTPQLHAPSLIVRDDNDSLRFDKEHLKDHMTRLSINTGAYITSSELTNGLGVNGMIFGASLDKSWPEFLVDQSWAALLRGSNESFDAGVGQLTTSLLFGESGTYCDSYLFDGPNPGKRESIDRVWNDCTMRTTLNQFTTTLQNELGSMDSIGTKNARYISQVFNGLTEVRGGLLVAMAHNGLNPGGATLKIPPEHELV